MTAYEFITEEMYEEDEEDDYEYEEYEFPTNMEWLYIMITLMLICSTTIVFTSLKIYGICTQQPKYIKMYIIFQYVLLALLSVAIIILSIYLLVYIHQHGLPQVWVFLLGVLIVLSAIFIWIIYTGFSFLIHTLIAIKQDKAVSVSISSKDNGGFELQNQL